MKTINNFFLTIFDELKLIAKAIHQIKQ